MVPQVVIQKALSEYQSRAPLCPKCRKVTQAQILECECCDDWNLRYACEGCGLVTEPVPIEVGPKLVQ